jgi:LPXTG-motif cell wall-anchored protein
LESESQTCIQGSDKKQKGLKHMSKSIFAKVAAVACSVASLGMLGIAASAQTNTEIADRTDLVAGKTNIVAGIVKADAGETVKFPVYIANNATGYAATGVRLIHDERLTVPLDGKKPKTTKGVAGNDVTTTFSYNAEKRIIGLGTMGTDLEKDNGVMYEVEITVPADAKDGDKFPMTIEIDKWLDASTNPVEHAAINGYIIVGGTPIETTTTSSTTVTTTTTTTTSSTAPTTSSTAPTTSSTAPTTSSTVSTQSTSSTASTTTTTGTNKGTPVVTTAKGGSTSSTTATKTGDAGVGVAVAGLLLAAGTAVVATKKKKD